MNCTNNALLNSQQVQSAREQQTRADKHINTFHVLLTLLSQIRINSDIHYVLEPASPQFHT